MFGSDVERVNLLGSNFNYTWAVQSLSRRKVGKWNAEILTAGAAGRSTISTDLVISSLVNLPLLSRDHCMHYSCEHIEYKRIEEKLS